MMSTGPIMITARWTGRMPNGKCTTSKRAYIKAWKTLIRPLEAMSFVVHAFDPGFTVSVEGHITFELPLYAAELIIARRKQP